MVYPSDVNEMKSCHQEATHEETSVARPPSRHHNGGGTTTMGSRVPVSRPMECGFLERNLSREQASGENQ
jgi:hypothetical protein